MRGVSTKNPESKPGPEVPASIANRRSPNGTFVDFHLLPSLLGLAGVSTGRGPIESKWTKFLAETGYTSQFQDIDGNGPGAANRAAADAWRLAELSGLIDERGLMDTGRRIADDPEDLAAVLALGIEKHLVSASGTEIVPLLRKGAAALAATDDLWARHCPGLLPIEMGTIVHWACVNERKCANVLENLLTWRDVAMHRRGEPDPRMSKSDKAGVHYEAVVDFYLGHPWLAERTPMPYGEELAMAKLLDFAGLLVEKPLGRFMCYLAPVE